MELKTILICEEIRNDIRGDLSAHQILDALSDGAYLEIKPWTQEEVEVAHAEVKDLYQKIQKKFGTSLSMKVTDFTPGRTDNFWGHSSDGSVTKDEVFLGCLTFAFISDAEDVDLDVVFDQIIDSLVEA